MQTPPLLFGKRPSCGSGFEVSTPPTTVAPPPAPKSSIKPKARPLFREASIVHCQGCLRNPTHHQISDSGVVCHQNRGQFAITIGNLPITVHCQQPTMKQQQLSRLEYDQLPGTPAVTRIIGSSPGRPCNKVNCIKMSWVK